MVVSPDNLQSVIKGASGRAAYNLDQKLVFSAAKVLKIASLSSITSGSRGEAELLELANNPAFQKSRKLLL